MRNLKRALSLALATVMTMGLMMVGSGASYTDVSSADNVEAIEVLQAVGIMTGDENGNFNPDANLTRNEMAVIMCNLLDYTVASYQGTAPFTDVPSWAEAYVAACYTNGITAGVSATEYGGDQEVTTGQAALMLLKALGYFQYQSDYGDDWLVETTKIGSTAGLFDGVDTGARSAVTRNDIAQMVLNALEADMVVADKSGSDITVGDITISGAKATYSARTGSDSKYTKIDKTTEDSKYTVQLGEELYDGKLVKAASAEDSFGRPASKWTYNSKEVGTYADEADGTYTTAVEKQELYDLIGSEVYNDLKDDDASFTVYVDGEEADSQKLSDYIVKNDDDDAAEAKKGAVTEVFVDDDTNDVVITVINYYVAQVDGDYDEDDEELDLSELDDSPIVGASDLTLSSDDFDYLDSYSDEDYVLVTVASGEIKTIQLAETISGAVSAYTKEKTVTLDGTKYEYSKNYTKAVADGSDLSYDLGDDYTLVLDPNGYVLYSDASDGTNDYVFVSDIARSGGVKSDMEANAYFMDGTNDVIVINNDDEEPFDEDDTLDTWFAYSVKSSGKYELDLIDEKVYTGQVGTSDNSGVITENGSASVYVNDTSASDTYGDKATTVRANSATIFVVNDDDDLAVYTGIKNVPDVKVTSGDATVSVVMDGSYADVVYIYGESLSISGDSGDRVYILDASPDASVDTDDNEYYEYDAIVNGDITTISAADDNIFTAVGLYQNVSYDSNSYVDDAKLVENASDDNFKAYTLSSDAIEYSNGVLSLGSYDIVLADDYTIFLNDDGDGKTTTPSKLARDYEYGYTGTIYVYEDDNDEAIDVYVLVVEAEEGYQPSDDAGITSITVKGVEVNNGDALVDGKTYTVDLTATANANDEQKMEVTVSSDKAEIKVTKDNSDNLYTAGNLQGQGAYSDSGTFKVVVTAEDESATTTVYVKVNVAAEEVKPVLTPDEDATAISSVDEAGDSAKITLANGTECTVSDLMAALTVTNASSDKMMTKGSLGSWVEAEGTAEISADTASNFKLVVVSDEGVTYTWTIEVADS